MKIIGIDPGINTGIVALDFQLETKKIQLIDHYAINIPSNKESKGDTFVVYQKAIANELLKLKGNIICVEHPAGRVSTIIPTLQRYTAILMIPYLYPRVQKLLWIKDCLEVYVPSWKKEIIGKGNAKKTDIAKWIQEKYPNEIFESQDEMDAIGIGLWATKHIEIETETI